MMTPEEGRRRFGWVTGGQGDEEERARAYREQHGLVPAPQRSSTVAKNTDKKAGQPADDAGVRQVEEAVAQADAQGFVGAKVDPTPNEAYTWRGVHADAPTPETDVAAAQDAEQAAGLGVEGTVENQDEPPQDAARSKE